MVQSEDPADDDAPTGPLPSVPDPLPERPDLISAESVRRQDLIAAAVVGAILVLALGACVATVWP
ncbi:hypothetical protein [Spirillospora sp. NPDC029432]|uniref:hypothetical protein n=1 Tax=Spirillospora sp. NPDC029432 TaxID=3154599 RepID=UPI0034528727